MMIYFENDSLDPGFNLAAEEVLLRDSTLDFPILLLWRNTPSVIIGRNQNTIEEVNREVVAKHQITVVRRLTGGGAVYHDLGNLNYSFILPDREVVFDFERWSIPVISAMKQLGIDLTLSGRNDLEINGKKISGSAQTRMAGRLLHHGTLLFNSNLDMLANVLNVMPGKFESKAVHSVRARVANIVEYLPENFKCDIESFKQLLLAGIARDGLETRTFSPQINAKIEALRRTKYATWKWNYGHSPPFNFRRVQHYAWGTVDLRMSVTHGVVESCSLYGDFFTSGDAGDLVRPLKGIRFDRLALSETLSDEFVRSVVPHWSVAEIIAQVFD